MARVVVRGPNDAVTLAVAEGFADKIRAACKESRVIGPAPCPLAKLRDNFRFHLLIKAAEVQHLHQALTPLAEKLKLPDAVQWIADIDPIDMM